MTYLGDLSSTTISVPKPDRSLLPGEFFRVRARGFPDPIIVRRLRDGSLLALSAVCTHKGCEVRPGPRSFECPCHGSAYHEDGTVKEGPATRPLERFPIRETEHGYLIEVIS
jgi:Rieske Fe-S protein